MATILGTRYGSAQGWGNAGMVKALDSGDIGVSTSDIAATNLIVGFQAPKGFVVTGIVFTSTDLDTNGTPTIAMTVGDAGSNARFMASTTIGQTGGVNTTLAAAGAGYLFTVDTDVNIRVATGAATAASGTLRLQLIGFMAQVYG